MNPGALTTEQRLLELLTAFREEGDLKARAELNERLREDPAARSAIARLLVDEQALIERLRQDDIVALLEAPARPRVASPSRRPSRTLPLVRIAIAASLVLTGFFVWMHLAGSGKGRRIAEHPTEPVAVIRETADAVWRESESPPGASLLPGTLRLASGMVAIEFASGARVLLEGPAEFEIRSGMEAFCRLGSLRADVPPPARGFTIGTPRARVVDTGTTFGLAVGDDGEAAVKVIQGEIELHQEKTIYRLVRDASAAIHASGKVVNTPIPDSRFPDERRFRDRVVAGDRLGMERWEVASSLVSRDPAALLCYTFQQGEGDDASVRNLAADPATESHGSPVGTAWTRGRWPGKRALEFSGRSDRVLFQLDRTSSAATYLAWVRFDSLSNAYNFLLMPDWQGQYSLQWMVTGQGEIRLALSNGKGDPSTAAGWDGPVKCPAVSNLDLGRWIFLASTYDSSTGTVVHYRDGRAIGSGIFPSRLPVKFGTYSFGNWDAGARDVSRKQSQDRYRNFNGRLDELAILSRALSAEEIARLHQEGKP